MIHFVAPQVEKIRAKIPELIKQVDVICGNLEDAIPAQDKEAARRGFIEMARANDFGSTGLWTRTTRSTAPGFSMTSWNSWPRSATSST